MHAGQRKFTNIAGAGTNTLRTGSGRLYGVIVNKAVLSSVTTIYDNTAGSGTIIATITQPATLLQSQFDLDYQGLQFNTGLTVVTSAADDITIVHS